MTTDDLARDHLVREEDREWRAFRYVLGEMSPAEAETFEQLLATDQELRELVAQSTGLVTNLLELSPFEAASVNAGLHAVPASMTPVSTRAVSTGSVRTSDSLASTRRRSRFGGWAVAGLSAVVCVGIAVGLRLLPFGNRSVLQEMYSSDSFDLGAGSLVAIWSQHLADFAPESLTTEPAASDRSDASLSGEVDDSRVANANENAPPDSPAAGDSATADNADVPDWMIAAVEISPIRHPGGNASEIREN